MNILNSCFFIETQTFTINNWYEDVLKKREYNTKYFFGIIIHTTPNTSK